MSFNLQDSYTPPFWAINKHIETIVPSLLKSGPNVSYQKEVYELEDGDFIELNWINKHRKVLTVILPGLESTANRSYVKSMAHYVEKSLHSDILVPNHRGCQEIPNRLFRSYHAGNSGDLELIFNHPVIKKYLTINLIGFSLGGNIVLKTLGERKLKIHRACTISAPLDLYKSSKALSSKENKLYNNRFTKNLKERLRLRSSIFPDDLSQEAINACKSVKNIDDLYTAPAHGFRDAIHYYSQNSSIKFIPEISTPTLMINAENDPMIPISEDEKTIVRRNKSIHFLVTKKGGHVAHPNTFLSGINWYEKRVTEFLAKK